MERAVSGRIHAGRSILLNGALGKGKVGYWFESGGGHRPYPGHKTALEWIGRHLDTPAMSLDQIAALPTTNAGRWCDENGVVLEKLYGTDLHQRGATLPDLGLGAIPREDLACLAPSELDSPYYTIEGWLATLS